MYAIYHTTSHPIALPPSLLQATGWASKIKAIGSRDTKELPLAQVAFQHERAVLCCSHSCSNTSYSPLPVDDSSISMSSTQ